MATQKKKTGGKLRAFLYLGIWLFTLAVFAGVIVIQANRYAAFRDELAQKEAALENERRVNRELLAQMDFYDSDAYIEQVAREQLGYVMPDEIIFQNEAE